MALSSQHVTGFVVGLGTAGLLFYAYKKNQPKIDAWLQRQGIQLPTGAEREYSAMSLEELVRAKEQLEDLIAEREVAADAPAASEASS